MNVTCVIPTRGDVDLTPILDTIPFPTIVWDNSRQDDLGIYGRYAAIGAAKTDVIVTQDDDVVFTRWDDLLAEYDPRRLTVNYPEPWDIPWVARGAVFHRDLPFKAFRRYWDKFPFDSYFTHRACDGVFALLTDVKVLDLGSTDLPHGFHAGRVSTGGGWYDRDRPMIQQRCAQL